MLNEAHSVIRLPYQSLPFPIQSQSPSSGNIAIHPKALRPGHTSIMGWFSPSRRTSSSYYRRRPRDGYIRRVVHQLKRILRDLYGYARRHPVKVFMLVVMPLVTGGALHNVLRQFGIRLPSAMFGGVAGGKGRYDDVYSSYSGRSGGEGFGGLGGGTIQSMMKVAQMFM